MAHGQGYAMKTPLYLLSLILGLSFATLMAPQATAQSYSIDWYKIAGGGGSSAGGSYQLSGTIGQPDAGNTLSGGNYSVTGGFWSLIAVVPMPGAPSLTIAWVGPTSVKISWPNTGSYTLQLNNNLAGASWSSFGGSVSSVGGTNSVTISPPVGNLFFRLKQ